MIAATITSMIPQGLVLTATVSFTIGAVVIARRGALVQRLNAVEAMAAIDVICTDKTGTLTTNRLRLGHLRVLADDLPEAEARRRLALFATASVDSQNKTIQALRSRSRRGGFGSDRPDSLQGAEPLQCRAASRRRHRARPCARRARGRRAESRSLGRRTAEPPEFRCASTPVRRGAAGAGRSRLLQTEHPPRPAPLCGSDRPGRRTAPDAATVLQALSAQGIAFKVISGDNPETVRGTVAHLNLPMSREPVVTGQDLANAADSDGVRRIPQRLRPRRTAAKGRDRRSPSEGRATMSP